MNNLEMRTRGKKKNYANVNALNSWESAAHEKKLPWREILSE